MPRYFHGDTSNNVTWGEVRIGRLAPFLWEDKGKNYSQCAALCHMPGPADEAQLKLDEQELSNAVPPHQFDAALALALPSPSEAARGDRERGDQRRRRFGRRRR